MRTHKPHQDAAAGKQAVPRKAALQGSRCTTADPFSYHSCSPGQASGNLEMFGATEAKSCKFPKELEPGVNSGWAAFSGTPEGVSRGLTTIPCTDIPDEQPDLTATTTLF